MLVLPGQPELIVHGGFISDRPPVLTHYSGFAGVGSFAHAWKLLGFSCLGGFEIDRQASSLFQAAFPKAQLDGDFYELEVSALPPCDVYDGGAPCQSWSLAGKQEGRVGRGELMFRQLDYLRLHRPRLGVFEQVPRFAVADGGRHLRDFLSELGSLGYVTSHEVMWPAQFDACQHRPRLIIVAVRADEHGRLGDFNFPAAVTELRPAKSVLTPLPCFDGERIPMSQYTPLPAPLHYDSGLIKVGSVAPHGRGCTVWSDEGLLPTQRCVGDGPAGATGLVLRGGVVTKVTKVESALVQQLPDALCQDETLTQEQIGNAVPLMLCHHLGLAISNYLCPGGCAAASAPTPTSAPTAEPTATPTATAPERASRAARARLLEARGEAARPQDLAAPPPSRPASGPRAAAAARQIDAT